MHGDDQPGGRAATSAAAVEVVQRGRAPRPARDSPQAMPRVSSSGARTSGPDADVELAALGEQPQPAGQRERAAGAEPAGGVQRLDDDERQPEARPARRR